MIVDWLTESIESKTNQTEGMNIDFGKVDNDCYCYDLQFNPGNVK